MPIGDQTMLENYKKHVAERAEQNIPPLPLDADQTSELIELLKKDHQDKIDFENKRNNSIRNEIEALHTKHAEEIEALKKEHEKTMKDTKF